MKTFKSLVLAPAVAAAAVTGLIAVPAVASTPPTSAPAVDATGTSVPASAGPSTSAPQTAASTQASAPATTTPATSASTTPANTSPASDGPEAEVAKATISQSDMADQNKGLAFSGTGFTKNSKATVTVTATDGKDYTPSNNLTVTNAGKVNGTYFFTVAKDDKVPVGDYKLFLTDSSTKTKTEPVEFEVVADGAATQKPTTSTSSAAPSTTAATSQAPSTAATSQAPSMVPTTTAPTTAAPTTTAPTTTAPTTTTPTPTATTSAPTTAPATTTPGTTAPTTTQPSTGVPSTKASDASAAPTTTAAEVDPTIRVEPETISTNDFSKSQGGGVSIVVENAEPGAVASLTVRQAQGKVNPFTREETVGADGTAKFGVRAKTSPIIGTYNLVVSVEGKSLKDKFTVVTNRSAQSQQSTTGGSTDVNGGADDSNSSGSSDSTSNALPRTGTEMTGLALGAGLLVVGAAAVIVTRRRVNSNDPADY